MARHHLVALGGGLRAHLLPVGAERDEGFRQEVLKLSHLSLRLIGGLELVVPLLMRMAGLPVIPVAGKYLPSLGVVLVGALTLGVSLLPWSRSRARLLAVLSVWLNSAVLEWSARLLASEVPWIDHYMLGYITLVMFGAVAAIPLQPLHTLALGLSLDLLHVVSRTLVSPAEPGPGGLQHLFTLLITLGCTALTAVVYRNRNSNYHAHRQALRASEDLRRAESRLLLSENAATTGRLAAALSHELNSPIGALISAVETLGALAAKPPAGDQGEQQRIADIVAEVRQSARESSRRLREIVARMQRFTNLDKAEVQAANLNELLSDVTALLEPRARGRVEVRLDLQPLPAVHCRPQQLSAVFSNLLSNAMDAISGTGRVTVSSRRTDSQIEVCIEDNGRGMKPDELASIFDPGFRVSADHVSTGHWSLFSTRQIVHEHGGDIRIASAAGRGTIVTVVLPC